MNHSDASGGEFHVDRWEKQMENVKRLMHILTPPVIWQVLGLYRNKWHREFEFVPEGWDAWNTKHDNKCWDDQSVFETQVAYWPDFLRSIEGSRPLDVASRPYGAGRSDLSYIVRHNIIMTYAYCLTLASRMKDNISMLDWGGAFGHYYSISRVLVPDLKIEYHCKEVTALAEHGRALFPEAHFYTDDTCLERVYDFVYASGVVQYSHDLTSLLRGLAGATGSFLAVNRIPIVSKVPSFVFVQRPYAHGYNTEFIAWAVNRDEFLAAASSFGLVLIREFLYERIPHIYKAPEQPDFCGFLFRKSVT